MLRLKRKYRNWRRSEGRFNFVYRRSYTGQYLVCQYSQANLRNVSVFTCLRVICLVFEPNPLLNCMSVQRDLIFAWKGRLKSWCLKIAAI